MENTGHCSIQGVRSYKQSSTEQEKDVSEVLNCAKENLPAGPTMTTVSVCRSNVTQEMNTFKLMKGITLNNCTDIHIYIHSN